MGWSYDGLVSSWADLWVGWRWARYGLDLPLVGLTMVCAGHSRVLPLAGWPLSGLAFARSVHVAVISWTDHLLG